MLKFNEESYFSESFMGGVLALQLPIIRALKIAEKLEASVFPKGRHAFSVLIPVICIFSLY